VSEGYSIVGVDPHNKRRAAVAITQNFHTQAKFKFHNTSEGLAIMLGRARAEMVKSSCWSAMFAIETRGHYWRNIAYYLEKRAIPFHKPTYVEAKARRKGYQLQKE
jgi:transposase